jgi:ketosteroid isomerase-like protein
MANWEDPGSVLAWLRRWEQLIRAQDFEAGEAMFRADAVGFGTVTDTTRSRAELLERQWRVVWPRTRDFSFVWEDVHVHVSREGSMAMTFAPWRSVGVLGTRQRGGRCTIGLVRDDACAPWLCVHTHFSMWPQSGDASLLDRPDI